MFDLGVPALSKDARGILLNSEVADLLQCATELGVALKRQSNKGLARWARHYGQSLVVFAAFTQEALESASHRYQ